MPVQSPAEDTVLRPLSEAFSRHDRQLYLVGGSLRDQLLGRSGQDYDLATDAEPAETKHIVRETRPRSTYNVGERFGTIGVVFDVGPRTEDGGPRTEDGRPSDGEARLIGLERETESEPERVTVEITTFRAEAYEPGSRKPAVVFGTSLADDLSRRDFTINAMARSLATGELVDPYGGQTDLKARTIRAVGDPIARFEEDPLRLLRAVRFVAQLGFDLDPVTRMAIAASADKLATISRERIQMELSRILTSPKPDRGLRLLVDLDLMRHIIPEVLLLRAMTPGARHKDVFEHTLKVVGQTKPDLTLRWAALLHDIAKPQTMTVENGEVHFLGHETLGAEMAGTILRRLKLDGHTIARVSKLVALHLRPNLYASDWTAAAVRRFIREAGDELDLLLALSRADVTSQRPGRVNAARSRIDDLERRCHDLLAAEDLKALKSPLDGDDLMKLFDKPPGPWIKPIKAYLEGLVIDGALAPDDKMRATELAIQFAAEQGIVPPAAD